MRDADFTAQVRRSLWRNIAAGIFVSVGVFAGVGGWAATTEVSGAVYARGSIVVDGYAKRVQHQSGGIVADVFVREGATVHSGDVLLRLDDTKAGATLAAVTKSILQLLARQARLEAERDGKLAVSVPLSLRQRLPGTEISTLMSVERRLFQARQAARSGQKVRLAEQQQQLREEIRGLTVQKGAKLQVIDSARDELTGLTKLFTSGLTAKSRVSALERAIYNLEGELGELIAAIAKAKGKIAEIDQQTVQIDQDLRAEVSAELRDVINERNELLEQERSLADELRRIDITAPISGTVHGLIVNTIGGVITPAETLMEIVPDGDPLTFEVRIDPVDIDQVSAKQDAYVRLTAFNRNTTPELIGRVARVSPDLETDEITGVSFYRVAIAVADSEQRRLGDRDLLPGMPVEAFIKTTDRTVGSYLLKPVSDHMRRVFREE